MAAAGSILITCRLLLLVSAIYIYICPDDTLLVGNQLMRLCCSVTNYFLVNLSVADLLVTLVCMVRY